MSMVQPAVRQFERFREQRAASVHVGRVEHSRRQLALLQCFAHQLEAARAVAQVQMQDAGLAGHHAGDMAFGCDPQQLIERRLARAMVADRDFADADQRFDEHEVAAHAAGQRRGRHVIATGVSVSVEPFLAQRINRRQQFTGAARDVVGAEQSDDGRDAGRREARQRQRRDASAKSGFAAAAGDVHVPVDEPGNRAASGRIDRAADCAQCGRQFERILADPENAPAADEQVLSPERAPARRDRRCE